MRHSNFPISQTLLCIHSLSGCNNLLAVFGIARSCFPFLPAFVLRIAGLTLSMTPAVLYDVDPRDPRTIRRLGGLKSHAVTEEVNIQTWIEEHFLHNSADTSQAFFATSEIVAFDYSTDEADIGSSFVGDDEYHDKTVENENPAHGDKEFATTNTISWTGIIGSKRVEANSQDLKPAKEAESNWRCLLFTLCSKASSPGRDLPSGNQLRNLTSRKLLSDGLPPRSDLLRRKSCCPEGPATRQRRSF